MAHIVRRQFSCSLIPHSLKRLAKKSRSQHEEKRQPQRVTGLLPTPHCHCHCHCPLPTAPSPRSVLQAPPHPSRRLLVPAASLFLAQPPLTPRLLILLFCFLLGNLRLRLRRSSLCCCFCLAWGFWHGINL